jgi:hypothetical protein
MNRRREKEDEMQPKKIERRRNDIIYSLKYTSIFVDNGSYCLRKRVLKNLQENLNNNYIEQSLSKTDSVCT